MTRSLLRAASAALLTTALVGSLAVGVAAPVGAAPARGTAAPAAPEVGSCHNLSYAEGTDESDPDPEVSCDRPHTSRTFLAPTVPDDVEMDDLDALSDYVAKTCSPAWRRQVHPQIKQRLLSSYSYYWFRPTDAQVEAGARWLRCDLVLLGGRTLAPLPAALTPQLGTAPHPNTEARCYGGARLGYRITVCQRPHQFRSRTAYQLVGKRYPTAQKFQRAGERRCAPVAGRKWATFRPTRAQWRGGFKWVICTTQTKR